MNSLLSLDLVNMGVDGWTDGWMAGWMDGWIMCEQETLFSLGSSSLANQSGQLGLVLFTIYLVITQPN
jgi:hypothetical protein